MYGSRWLETRVLVLAFGGVLGTIGGLVLVVHEAWLGMTLPCATIGGEELERAAQGRVESWLHDQHATGCRSQALDADGREVVSIAIERDAPCAAGALGGETFRLADGIGDVSHRGGIYELRMPIEHGCIAVRVGDGALAIERDDVAALASAIGRRRAEAVEYVRTRR